MLISFLFKNQKFQRTLLAFLTGAAGTLAFSPYNIWPTAILSLIGLLMVTLNPAGGKVAWFGFVWGLGLFGTGIHWVYVSIAQFEGIPYPINVGMVVILTGYLALYPLLFSTLLVQLWPRKNPYRLILGAPVVWSLTEFSRAKVLTGFPWLQFGYSQIDGPLKGLAPILGVEAITFLLMMISGLVVWGLEQRRLLPILIGALTLLLPWPLHVLHWYQAQPQRTINVTLVQGNIDQSIKWHLDHIQPTLNIYLHHTLPKLNKTQMVIWPEAAIPDNEIDQNTFLTELDQKLRIQHTSLITGIIDAREKPSQGYDYYNSIVVLGEPIPYRYPNKNRYHKHHLVPFGETVPLKNLLLPLANFFNLPISTLSQGNYLQPQLIAAGMKLTATVCYEIIVGSQVRDNFRPDSDFLLNISNNAWFGYSIGPWQYFQMARMRSLELGRPLLLGTNNGITAIIDADGKPQAQLPQFTREILNFQVTPTNGMTPYAYAGSWPLWIFTMISGFIALVLGRKIIL